VNTLLKLVRAVNQNPDSYSYLYSCLCEQSLTGRFVGTFAGLRAGRERANACLVDRRHSELVRPGRVRLEIPDDEVKVTDRLVKVVGARPARGGLRPVLDDIAVQSTSAVVAG